MGPGRVRLSVPSTWRSQIATETRQRPSIGVNRHAGAASIVSPATTRRSFTERLPRYKKQQQQQQPEARLGVCCCCICRVRNVDYSILFVMSELSTVRCDRALGLWIAGTRASSVDGELPWMSSSRAAAVASTPGSRAQAATEGGFLGLRHKTKEADGG